MSAQQGTLDIIAVELGELFRPLVSQMQTGNARRFLADLGYVISEAQENNLAATLLQTGLATGELVQISGDIVSAVAQEDYGKVTEKVIEAGKKTKILIESFDGLRAALSAQGATGDLSKFAERLLGFLVSDYIRRKGLGAPFELLGIIETTHYNVTSVDPANPPYSISRLRLDRIPKWFSDPVQELKDQFDWGNPAFDGTKLLPRLANVIGMTGLPAIYLPDHVPPLLDMVFAEARADTTVNPRGLFVGLASDISLHNLTIRDEDWEAVFNFDLAIPSNAGIVFQPDGQITLRPPDATSISASADATLTIARNTNPTPFIIIGQAGSSRLEFLQLVLQAGTRLVWNTAAGSASGNFSFGARISNGKVVIKASDGDGFIQKILSGVNTEATFNLGIGYSSETGFYFEGSGGIQIQLPLHVSLGPISFEGVTIAMGISPDDIPITLGGNLKVELGPLSAVVENIGLIAKITFPEQPGNLGPGNLDIGFKPPNGVGLSINAGAVMGGGYLFFDFDKEEYAGVLELSIAGFISAKAIGLITTKMPDGTKGFSMLIIITAEFNPPFQLGYGFTLIGVGGLLGLNRTVLLDPLREGVRTGAINSIMFPQNVVANAPRIISDLKAIFPAYESRFLIGPMGKIGYGTPTLISLSLGLIIEIPGNIAILGVLKIVLPDEQVNLIKIQVAFVGTIDFDKKLFTFDASLFESNILFMTLEGDMAVRLRWGDNPDFLMSVGGFHPSYIPPPLALPTLRRLAINILNTDYARIRVECYQAITSNTIQFGAAAELYFGFSAISIEGHFSFDALFQFSPFYFIVGISGSVSLKVFGTGVFSIRLQLQLEGPTPWRAKGSGSLSILFFEISADFDKTWGDTRNTSLPDIEVLPLLMEQLKKNESWTAALGNGKNLLVSLRQFKEAPDNPPLVLHPAGALVIHQKLLPLQVLVEKIGNQKTSDIQKAFVSKGVSGTDSLTVADVEESFARAQYQALSDAEKLSKPSFEKMPGGVSVSLGSGSIKNGRMVRKSVDYERTIIDKAPEPVVKKKKFRIPAVLFQHFLKGNSVSKSTLSRSYRDKLQPFAQKVAVAEEGFAVAYQADNRAHGASTTFASEALAATYLQEQIRKDPNLKKKIHVVPTFELQTP